MGNPLDIRETDRGLEIRLHVQPRAKRCQISGEFNAALKIKVTAPPVDEAANKAVKEYLAELLGVAKSKIRILSGARSRDKTLLIQDISREEFLKRIEAQA
jgi:uncharacterized protein (TIGR00251 family)